MKLSSERFCRWLHEVASEAGMDDLIWVPGPQLTDKPDRICTVDRGSSRTIHDGAMEQIPFVLRMRGLPHQTDMPEQMHADLEKAVLSWPTPCFIDSLWLSSIWLSSGPVAVPGTPDLGQRFESFATYQVQIG